MRFSRPAGPIALVLSAVVWAVAIAPSAAAPAAGAASSNAAPPTGASSPAAASPAPARPSAAGAAVSSAAIVPSAAPYSVTVKNRIALTPSVRCGRTGAQCVLRYDLYVPTGPGPWPIVVVAPGGPNSPTALGRLVGFAHQVAAGGAVVMVATWRQGDRYGGTVPTAFGDIGCAVRTARAIATSVGGDARRIVLLGHSLGGWAGAVVMLDAAASTPPTGQCLVPTGSTRPAAFIGIAGTYAGPAGDQDDVDWADLLGASRLVDSARWDRADPLGLATRSPARHVPVLLIHGLADRSVGVTQTRRFAAELRRASWQPRVLIEPGMGHSNVLTAPATIREISALLSRLPKA